MKHNALTARTVASLSKRGTYRDGHGLCLQISQWGTKAWIFAYTLAGRERFMGLGSIHTLTLAEAREKARELRKAVLEGRDPIAEKASQRAAPAVTVMTFKDAAEKYIAAHEASWSNPIHRKQWDRSLEAYVYPPIGALPVADIALPHIISILEPNWSAKAETMSRVRGRIESILDWATVRGYRSGENPARWKGHLQHLLPKRSKVQKQQNFAALPYSEIGSFMAMLRTRDIDSARALEFAILSCCRVGEVLGATADEFDLAARLWTIPAERMKARKPHRVPLTERMSQLLQMVKLGAQGEAAHRRVFAVRPETVLHLAKSINPTTTVHGFRATFKTWASECTNYPNECVEISLAHTVGSKVEQAYQRGDLFNLRRRLMEEWTRYCGTLTQSHIIPLRAAK